MSFFKSFPTLFYNGQQAKNIMARARLTDTTKKNLSMYYPYNIKDGDGRAEVLSYAYYNDPYAVWMIYFANDVVDPYYDLGLSDADFSSYIVKKYGSIETAQSKIAFYRTNWQLLEDSEESILYYENLDASEKHYWEPVLDIYGSINSYKRKQEDLIVNTNRIYELTLSDSDGVFTVGEKVSANSTMYGYCVYSNSSMLTLNHITGINATNISTMTVIGSESNTSATVDTSVLLAENISANVQAKYWSSVSFYDNEEEVNSLKKNIKLINNQYKSQLEDELKKTMRS